MGVSVGLTFGVGVVEGVGCCVGIGVAPGVVVGVRVKLAVIVPGPFMVAIVDCALGFCSAIAFVSFVHCENWYPEFGVAVICI